jgi:hypothetical protein
LSNGLNDNFLKAVLREISVHSFVRCCFLRLKTMLHLLKVHCFANVIPNPLSFCGGDFCRITLPHLGKRIKIEHSEVPLVRTFLCMTCFCCDLVCHFAFNIVIAEAIGPLENEFPWEFNTLLLYPSKWFHFLLIPTYLLVIFRFNLRLRGEIGF